MKYRVSDLKNFIETANCETMVAASRKLGITQPALSESIKRFESDLGAVLFYRSRSGIQLTPNGKEVLNNAKVALSSLLEVETVCENKVAFSGRSISIGCHPVVASYTLPKALKDLGKRAPDYKVVVKHAASREIQNLIQRGQVDIGIVVNPIPVPDLVIKKLAVDEVCVWSNGKNLDKLICNMDLHQTQAMLRKWKNYPADVIDTESLELITRLVESGIGYGIIPERAVLLLTKNLHKHTELPVFKDTICLVYRPEFGKTAFEKEVVAALSNSLADF